MPPQPDRSTGKRFPREKKPPAQRARPLAPAPQSRKPSIPRTAATNPPEADWTHAAGTAPAPWSRKRAHAPPRPARSARKDSAAGRAPPTAPSLPEKPFSPATDSHFARSEARTQSELPTADSGSAWAARPRSARRE